MSILFDLDDTLIPTQDVYNETKEQALSYIFERIHGQLEKGSILKEFETIDKQNFSLYGLSKERFPTSWVKTLNSLKETNEKEEKELYAIAQRVFEKAILPFSEAVGVLTSLNKKGYHLSLLTAGDRLIQEKRIRDANLSFYFEEVYILPEKTPQSVKKQLEGTNLEQTIMIGNSLRSDIYPALELGMKAIHIERDTWAYDLFDVNKQDENYFSTTLEHLEQTIEKIEMLTKNDIFLKNEKGIS